MFRLLHGNTLYQIRRIIKNFVFGIGHVITGTMIIFALGPISYGGKYLGLISLYRLDILGGRI